MVSCSRGYSIVYCEVRYREYKHFLLILLKVIIYDNIAVGNCIQRQVF